MRIAYLLSDPGIGIFGTKGASVHVQEVIRALRAHGHEVTVYCTRRGDTAGHPETEAVPEDLADLDVITVPVAQAIDAADRETEIALAAARMAELAAADSQIGRPYRLIYERYSLFSDAGAQLKSRLLTPGGSSDDPADRAVDAVDRAGRGADPVQLIMEVNAPLIPEQRTHRSLHDVRTAQRTTVEALSGADVISCVSEPVAEWAVTTLITAETAPARRAVDRIAVIPNGVNTDRIRPADRSVERPFTIGFVGTLKPWHGTDVLLRAVAASAHPERRDWRVELIGRGPEQGRLEELAAQLGIADQVHFHGAVPPAEVPTKLGRFDVAVAPYPPPGSTGGTGVQEHYFSPLKVYEYLAAGLTVVASAVGELPAVLSGTSESRSVRISDGERGLLVPPGDAEALANALDQLAAHPQLRARLAFAGRAAVVERHTWTRRVGDLLRLLNLPSETHAGLTTPIPVISCSPEQMPAPAQPAALEETP